jgi:hypothetical protein
MIGARELSDRDIDTDTKTNGRFNGISNLPKMEADFSASIPFHSLPAVPVLAVHGVE